jgi:hypothetical protein
MAHVGLDYPVVFNRDWNLNRVTNRGGWAHRNLVVFKQFPQGIGNAFLGLTWDCGPDYVNTFGELSWDSPTRPLAGKNFFCRLRLVIGADNAQYRQWVELWEFAGPVMLSCEIAVGEITRNSDWRWDQGLTNRAWNPLYFDGTTALTICTILPKRWADGAPH